MKSSFVGERPPRLPTTGFLPGIAVERNIERRRESSALNGVGGYTFHLQRRGCAIVAVASER